jgi:hypothetical protein
MKVLIIALSIGILASVVGLITYTFVQAYQTKDIECPNGNHVYQGIGVIPNGTLGQLQAVGANFGNGYVFEDEWTSSSVCVAEVNCIGPFQSAKAGNMTVPFDFYNQWLHISISSPPNAGSYFYTIEFGPISWTVVYCSIFTIPGPASPQSIEQPAHMELWGSEIPSSNTLTGWQRDMVEHIEWWEANPNARCGDVTFDGIINVNDSIMISQMIVGIINPTPDQMIVADVNTVGAPNGYWGDGWINVFDLIMVMRYIIQEITETDLVPCGKAPGS